MQKKKRLNEILAKDNKMPGFLKFSSKKNLESLQSGVLYLNNFQFYKDVELEEKRKGQGDALDVTLRISDVDLTFKNPKTDEVLFKAKARNADLGSKEDHQRHLFCITGITTDLLEVLEVTDDTVATRLVLPDELKEKALENFGDHVMLIDAGLFTERVQQICAKNGIKIIRNVVDYRDMTINYSDRIEAFSTGHADFFFQKDNFFAYQNEYRLLFPELISDKEEVIDIGNIKEFTHIIPTEKFFEHELQFRFQLIDKVNKK